MRCSVASKAFLLGVGCQKGGTTWMHDYLSGLPDCAFGDHKEYHVFDYTRAPVAAPIAVEARRRLANWRALLAAGGSSRATHGLEDRIAKAEQLEALRADPQAYADHFDQLWARDDRTRLVGDITPSYALLCAEDFRFIRDLLAARGFAVRVVFLMRDPIDRIYSQARMIAEHGHRRGLTKSAAEVFAEIFREPKAVLRSRYEHTLAALDASFDPADVFLAFHEEFFSEDEIRRLTGFLGVGHAAPNFGRTFSNPSAEPLPEALLSEARMLVADTYAYCADRFGEARLRRLWRHF